MYEITDSCIACSTCINECLNEAIKENDSGCKIDQKNAMGAGPAPTHALLMNS
jgi:ferredoxin